MELKQCEWTQEIYEFYAQMDTVHLGVDDNLGG